jgi:hypothetical protein
VCRLPSGFFPWLRNCPAYCVPHGSCTL